MTRLIINISIVYLAVLSVVVSAAKSRSNPRGSVGRNLQQTGLDNESITTIILSPGYGNDGKDGKSGGKSKGKGDTKSKKSKKSNKKGKDDKLKKSKKGQRLCSS